MRQVTIAATQMTCSTDRDANLAKAEAMVREAAGQGAEIVLLQELFESVYFCKEQSPDHFALAYAFEGNPLIARMSRLAAELGVVLPVSFFERANNAFFNSLAMIDADGRVMGVYRKSHVPDGPGYQEKYYFTPGDTGFRVWQTRYGCLGVGICWDQWFPECSRAMAVMGAELLFFPTAIGSEPQDPTIDSRHHWRRAMQGHSASNCMPVIASNRIGSERAGETTVTFYGTSFITDATGGIVADLEQQEGVITASFDLDALAKSRAAWGLFRDRRPDLYLPLLTLDGRETGL
jgi:N-carbamoylputrescine amidase